MHAKKMLVALSMLGLTHIVIADTQTQINSLQTQIAALQQEASTQPSNNSATNLVGLDTAMPLGKMSKTSMPLDLLKAKSTLSQPWVLGGQIQLDAEAWGGDSIPTASSTDPIYHHSSHLSLSKVYLFNMMNLGQNVTGMLSVINSRPSQTAQVDRAFLVFGNLQKWPVYVTAGYTYLPFGSFSGNGLLDDALTTNLFRVSPTNQVAVNALWRGFTANIGAFSNNTNDKSHPSWMTNVNYKTNLGLTNLSVGAGYISDIRGTHSGLGDSYALNGATTSTSLPLQNGAQVPVYDLNFSVGIPLISAIGEYDSTTRGGLDHGRSIGNLSAWMLGTKGGFAFMNVPYDWQISYSHTHNMAHIPMKLYGNYDNNLKSLYGFQSEWMTSIAGEFWKNVYVGPEFSYNKTYTNNLDTYTIKLDLRAYF